MWTLLAELWIVALAVVGAVTVGGIAGLWVVRRSGMADVAVRLQISRRDDAS